MQQHRFLILLFALATIFASCVFGEIVPLRPCGDESICNIKEVRVSPCTTPKKTCDQKQKKTAKIELDFVPNFSSDKLIAKASTTISGREEFFRDLPENGCESLTGNNCPIVSGKEYNYKYGLTISENYPVGTYTVKWQLKGEDESQNCCAFFKIRIKK